MHDVAHEDEPRAELSAGMEDAEIAGGETLRLEQRHSQGVAEHELHRRRRGRREAVRAGFLSLRQNEPDIGLAAERAFRIGRDRDERNTEPARVIDDVGELRRLAGPG